MKISELPPKIRQNALKYQAEETREFYSKKTDIIQDAFRWHDTQEGYIYWLGMHRAKPSTTCYRLFYLGLTIGLLTALAIFCIWKSLV